MLAVSYGKCKQTSPRWQFLSVKSTTALISHGFPLLLLLPNVESPLYTKQFRYSGAYSFRSNCISKIHNNNNKPHLKKQT